MSTKNSKKEYYDGWDGLAGLMKEKSKSVDSQCAGCENEVGIYACKKFGEKPRKYFSVLANVKCPERKVK
jgi:hypothetical protein